MSTESSELIEWTVVSDCLIRPDEAHDAIDLLTPAAFEHPGARDVYATIRDLHTAGVVPDVVAVIESMEQSGKLTRLVADRLREAGLQERCATPIIYYARKVLANQQRRQAREIVSDAHNHLCNGTNLDETLSELFDRLAPLQPTDGTTTTPRRRQTDGFVSFPVGSLPAVVRVFAKSVAHAIGCDTVFAILPVLVACAAAIGNTRRLQVKRDWNVPAILWGVAIGESGTQKSPPMRMAMKPFWKRQQDMRQEYDAAFASFKDDQRQYKSALRKNEKSGGDLPDEPQKPSRQRCLVNDVNVEGLAPVLQENPRGVLLARDELSGWLGSFDKYSSGGGGKSSADAAAWLSIYNGEPIEVTRKDSERDSFVSKPAVSIYGTVQPGVLNRAIGHEHRENGLLARLLLAFPPRVAKQWSDNEVSFQQEEAYALLIDKLYSLQMDTKADGTTEPAKVTLDSDSREIFKTYCNEHGQEHAGLTGEMAAAWSKLEEIPARLALVVHCIRQVSGESVDPWVCDAVSMNAGIVMAEWFKSETQRVYRLLGESQQNREQNQLVEWIRQRGGRIRPRDLLNGRREIETAEDAENLLTSLVKAGFGRWEYSTNQRGPAARELVLTD